MSIEEKLELQACEKAADLKLLAPRTIPQSEDDTLSRRQEKLALIRILRDETHSQSIKARCVALVGER